MLSTRVFSIIFQHLSKHTHVFETFNGYRTCDRIFLSNKETASRKKMEENKNVFS